VTAGTRGRVLLHSLAFIAGFTQYRDLGVSVSAAGQFLLDYRDWIRVAGGPLIIVFGSTLRAFSGWPLRALGPVPDPAEAGGLIGSFAWGLTFAIGWTPCVGPIWAPFSRSRAVTVRGAGHHALCCLLAGWAIPFLLSRWR